MNSNVRILAVVDEKAHDTGVQQVSESQASGEHAADTTHGQATDSSEVHTTESTAHEEESQGIAALGIDPFAIGAQALTFLVLFFIIKKYALSAIVSNLETRRKDINRGLRLTAEMDKQKAELDERVDAALKEARKDADAIIAEANTESGRIIRQAEESASRKADDMLMAAEGKIEREIAEARKGLRIEMAALVSEATEAILRTKLTVESDRKLVEDYVNEALK